MIITIPLYLFLFVYLIFLLVFIVFTGINIGHIIFTGSITFTSVLFLVVVLGLIAVTLFLTVIYLWGVNWGQVLGTWGGSLPDSSF